MAMLGYLDLLWKAYGILDNRLSNLDASGVLWCAPICFGPCVELMF